MPRFDKIADESTADRPRRISLDERFVRCFLGETALAGLEAQELRQVMLQALQELRPAELKVIELRHQHKRSPGQVAAQLGLSRDEVRVLEARALARMRAPLSAYLED